MQLHFANPKAYHDIYNNQNRWDKEPHLYHSFNEDRSSFGYLTYKEAKPRKDALNKLFSQRAIAATEGLIVEKVGPLYQALARETDASCRSMHLPRLRSNCQSRTNHWTSIGDFED